jgi:hypothetical protein
MLDDKLKGSLSGFVGALLLRDYNVLVAFTEYNRNVIRLEPPLICQREHVDQFVDSLDRSAGRGIVSIVKDFVKSQVGRSPQSTPSRFFFSVFVLTSRYGWLAISGAQSSWRPS